MINNGFNPKVVKKLLIDRKITQTELANEMGYNKATLSAKLKGNKSITVKDLIFLSNFFNCSKDIFFN